MSTLVPFTRCPQEALDEDIFSDMKTSHQASWRSRGSSIGKHAYFSSTELKRPLGGGGPNGFYQLLRASVIKSKQPSSKTKHVQGESQRSKMYAIQ